VHQETELGREDGYASFALNPDYVQCPVIDAKDISHDQVAGADSPSPTAVPARVDPIRREARFLRRGTVDGIHA
jgi:hypothetical protein